MPKGRVVYAKEADADLRRLARYIAESSGEARSDTIIARIKRTIRTVSLRPRIGRPQTYLTPDARAFTVRPWIIFYRVLPDGNGIRVTRIVDGRRDLTALFGQNP